MENVRHKRPYAHPGNGPENRDLALNPRPPPLQSRSSDNNTRKRYSILVSADPRLAGSRFQFSSRHSKICDCRGQCTCDLGSARCRFSGYLGGTLSCLRGDCCGCRSRLRDLHRSRSRSFGGHLRRSYRSIRGPSLRRHAGAHLPGTLLITLVIRKYRCS